MDLGLQGLVVLRVLLSGVWKIAVLFSKVSLGPGTRDLLGGGLSFEASGSRV